jgi:hypothetical protein
MCSNRATYVMQIQQREEGAGVEDENNQNNSQKTKSVCFVRLKRGPQPAHQVLRQSA